MKTKIILSVLGIGLLVTLLIAKSPLPGLELPAGWFKAGDKPGSYDMGMVKVPFYESVKDLHKIKEKDAFIGDPALEVRVATIHSIEEKIDGFGTLMQQCKPGIYLGNRVRMSGYMKTENLSEWAGFWFRVDGKDVRDFLAFDNFKDGKKDRSVKGTTPWTRYEIVLEVPQGATNLAYGALLAGTGQIWFDHITFEIVDKNVPTTGYTNDEIKEKAPEKNLNQEPTNLDFEK
ncbi:MAG TPA: hypothetical protein VI757_12825 [Bacteroidia bacterium]|nr:hypothetical protein [Bacteroidia bacterium]